MGRFRLRRDFFLAYLEILLAKFRSSKAVCQLEMLIFYALVEYILGYPHLTLTISAGFPTIPPKNPETKTKIQQSQNSAS